MNAFYHSSLTMFSVTGNPTNGVAVRDIVEDFVHALDDAFAKRDGEFHFIPCQANPVSHASQ